MFKLNIECTKDISELHINFTDGTSAVVEKPSTPVAKSPKPKVEKQERVDPRFRDFDEEPVQAVSNERIKLPEIPEVKRDVKVASELQNLDI